MTEYSLGDVRVTIEDENALLRLAPLDDRVEVQETRGVLAIVHAQDGATLTCGLAFFPQAEPRLSGLELIAGDERYARAAQAGNASVRRLADGGYGMCLQMFKFSESGRFTLHGTTWDELDNMLGFGFRPYLRGLGAVEFGTGGSLLNTSGRTRNVPAFTVPRHASHALLVAWAATRVVPLMKRYGQAEIAGVL